MRDPVGLAGDPPGRAADEDIQRQGEAGILTVGVIAVDQVRVGLSGRQLVGEPLVGLGDQPEQAEE
jgi:hypothetical protein